MWFPVLVFSPFIVDASVTLVKRLLRGEKVWQAHREHYYQRLVQMGWGHRNTAIAEYVLMLAVGASAILLLNKSMSVIVSTLVLWILLYVWLMRMIDKRWAVIQCSGNVFR
jgi:UDP-N-acetylmuramyl pentapeptide phosphotransferase/UDP-N-acetylglucosamine-1-phosphate transferase